MGRTRQFCCRGTAVVVKVGATGTLGKERVIGNGVFGFSTLVDVTGRIDMGEAPETIVGLKNLALLGSDERGMS